MVMEFVTLHVRRCPLLLTLSPQPLPSRAFARCVRKEWAALRSLPASIWVHAYENRRAPSRACRQLPNLHALTVPCNRRYTGTRA